ncbi:hypothetical protein F4775DRAFT_567090 [Biscogniauxia sp. FL1348]|nr:hypothetical protein F4775DRAFT_567090 [Biscogniauxia sp. FL1348]
MEERFATALVTSRKHELPIFTMLYLSEWIYWRLLVESERTLYSPSRGQFAGIARSYLPVSHTSVCDPFFASAPLF